MADARTGVAGAAKGALVPASRRALVFELAWNDFKVRYTGSLLGALWAFAQPVLTILLYLFVYQVGFRSSPPQNVPFVLWLIVGIAPWFYFVDALATTTPSYLEYSFLVKKVMFDVGIVPWIKLVSSSFIHAVVWGIVLVVLVLSGISPKATWALLPYYFVALFAVASALGWLAAALTPFFRDLGQIVAVGIQFGFWLTPVVWPLSNAPERFRPLLAGNPVYYVVDGLRDALLFGRTPLAHPVLTAYFWGFVVVVHALAHLLFRRLRPHLADVL